MNITASTNFTVAAGISARSSNGTVLNTAGWTVTVGDGTSGYINDAGPLTVTGGGAIAYNTDSTLTGTLTIASGTTLEVTKSGTVKLSGALDLEAGAILAFNFTKRTVTPQIAIAEGNTLTVEGAVKVKIPEDSKWPTAGEKILTTCGGFTAEKVTLVDGAPKWVRGLSVNADGNIVLDVKPMGTRVIVR